MLGPKIRIFDMIVLIKCRMSKVQLPFIDLTWSLTLTLPVGAIFARIQSQIDAADNSYCQETSLTGIRPVM